MNDSRSELINLLPYDYVKINRVIAFTKNGTNRVISEKNISGLLSRELWRHFNGKFNSEVIVQEAFNKALTEIYSLTKNSSELEETSIEEYDLKSALNSIAPTEDLLSGANDAPITRLINAIISEAIAKRASDIHFEPYEDNFIVRFRIDGQLLEVFSQDIRLAQPITSRIKIISRLDIAERRKPQDGRISLSLGTKKIDVRVSTLPSSYGERLVLRILDKDGARVNLEELGFNKQVLTSYQDLLKLNEGIILVTGPTGSGKTTTLYAGLEYLNSKESNILTVEDPIEYTLAGIGQTQVNPKTGYTFASGLRSILRQDPDIVMVGEIRDKETAVIATQASLTGHLVLSTVHTNSAIGAITRLRDIGIESYLLASSIRGILSQRLIRKLCSECKTERLSNAIEQEKLKLQKKDKVYDAQGCDACNDTGYHGRIPIVEMILIDEHLKALIHAESSEQEFVKYLQGASHSMSNSSVQLLLEGQTSSQEVFGLLSNLYA
jgi:general secretion pathway protein E|tara:strand:- start:2301 stop:3785 length:1485 start_codon:yes stop_codon:yes gene_type:complete